MEENRERKRSSNLSQMILRAGSILQQYKPVYTCQIKLNKQNLNGIVSYVCICSVNVRVDLRKLFYSVSCFYRLKARAQLQS